MGPLQILGRLAERVEERYGEAIAGTDWDAVLEETGGLPFSALPRETRVITLVLPVTVVGLAAIVEQLCDRVTALETGAHLGDEPPEGCG